MTYEFKTEPWKHQRKTLTDSWDKLYWALLFEYGCGKTKVVIDTAGINFEITKAIDALFIIAPNNVHAQWVDEQVPEHLPERIPTVQRVWTGSNSKKFKRSLEDFWLPNNEDKLKIFAMNVEALQSSERARSVAVHFLKSFQTLLAVDESTRIKTPGAKRAKFIVNRLSKLAYMRRTLTGNEVTRSPFDVYMPYKFLETDFWKGQYNFHTFQHRYASFKKQRFYRKDVKVKDWDCPKCPVPLPGFEIPPIEKIDLKRMGGKVFPTCPECNSVIPENKLPTKVKRIVKAGGNVEFSQPIGYKNLDELKARIAECSSLVRKEDCMDLPPKIYQPIYTEMNDEQIRVYQELKKNLYTEYHGVELEVLHKVALRTRFRQIVGGFFPTTGEMIGNNNPKVDALMYDLEDINCSDPLIVWASFTAEIEQLEKVFKREYDGRVVSFYGETPKPDRKQIIQDFKSGNIDYFIANPSVAGTGLNLQRAYINYYFSNSDNAEDRWQSEDRTHRGGQTEPVLIKDIFIRGTIDDVQKKSNTEKKTMAEYFKSDRIEDFLELV